MGTSPAPPDRSEAVELLSAAHHAVLFMSVCLSSVCVRTRKERILVCCSLIPSRFHTHTHTPVLSAKRAASKRLWLWAGGAWRPQGPVEWSLACRGSLKVHWPQGAWRWRRTPSRSTTQRARWARATSRVASHKGLLKVVSESPNNEKKPNGELEVRPGNGQTDRQTENRATTSILLLPARRRRREQEPQEEVGGGAGVGGGGGRRWAGEQEVVGGGWERSRRWESRRR